MLDHLARQTLSGNLKVEPQTPENEFANLPNIF